MAKIVFVVAVARNGVIGRDGALPWRLPSDLKRFREATWGRPMIMGRKTFDSIGRPLPGRETIVVTRDADFARDGVHVAHSLEDALELAQARAQAMGTDEVAVVGGAEVYARLLPQADRAIVTEVAMEPEGDVRLAPFDAAEWRETMRETPPRGPKDEADYIVRTLERRPRRAACRGAA